MKTIGIVGKGFVGTAVFEGMKHAFDVIAYDTHKGWSYSIDKVDYECNHFIKWPMYHEENHANPFMHLIVTCDVIFVCVPSPMKSDGSCDLSIADQVLGELNAANEGLTKRVVVLKSTLVPGTTEAFNAKYENLNICFNPEFLRERTFIEDFKRQDRIIVGGPHEGTAVVKQMYERAYPAVPVTKTSSTIAELVKYLTNCFLSVKASFANEVKQICDGLGVDYDKVIEYALKDDRLGKSHWSVPGPDGDIGWGGKCFPKDLNALMFKARELGVDPKVMEAAWQKNLELRQNRDWERIPGAVSKE